MGNGAVWCDGRVWVWVDHQLWPVVLDDFGTIGPVSWPWVACGPSSLFCVQPDLDSLFAEDVLPRDDPEPDADADNHLYLGGRLVLHPEKRILCLLDGDRHVLDQVSVADVGWGFDLVEVPAVDGMDGIRVVGEGGRVVEIRVDGDAQLVRSVCEQ